MPNDLLNMLFTYIIHTLKFDVKLYDIVNLCKSLKSNYGRT